MIDKLGFIYKGTFYDGDAEALISKLHITSLLKLSSNIMPILWQKLFRIVVKLTWKMRNDQQNYCIE